MLDLPAAGEGRAPRALGTVSVDHGPQAALARLATGGVELLLAQRGRAADPDAGGREDLDHVRARLGQRVHARPDLLRSAAPGRDRLDRGQDPRTRQRSARNRVPDRHILGSAEALHRRDAAREHVPRVLGRVERPVRRRVRRLRAAQPPRRRVEVPAEMDVRVDESRQRGRPREFVDHGAVRGPRLGDGFDPSVAHHEFPAREHGAAPVEDPVRPDHDRGARTGGVQTRRIPSAVRRASAHDREREDGGGGRSGDQSPVASRRINSGWRA